MTEDIDRPSAGRDGAGLAYDVVDVFCDRPFAGNPLAVVQGTGDLTTDQLQALAREFNLSETTFPTPRDSTSYSVRIFTTDAELPFAGHPTVGTAWLLRRHGELDPGNVVQHCGLGPVDVVVTDEGAEMTALPRYVTDPADGSALAAAVGLAPDDVVGGSRVASCGLGWRFLRVRPGAVARAVPSPGLEVEKVGDDPMDGVCVFAVDQGSRGSGGLQVHSRAFYPEQGIIEDPATGSAAVALGLVLVADGVAVADGTTAYTIAQGAEAHRPSTLYGSVDAEQGTAVRTRVRGRVAHIASGTIAVPR